MAGMPDPSKIGKQVLTAGLGAIQLLQAHHLKKEAASAMPGFYDPQQQQFLSELNQKRRSLDTGSGYAAGMNAIGATTAGTQNGILSAGGGNVGGTMQALLQSQRLGSDQQNQVLANGEQQNMQYNQMYNELLDKVAGRKMQLQLLNHDHLYNQWQQKQKAGSSNLMAGLGMAASGNQPKDQSKGNSFSNMFGGGSGTPTTLPGMDAAAPEAATSGGFEAAAAGAGGGLGSLAMLAI
jgi:hypothetical protein